jgi:hypothetical protein
MGALAHENIAGIRVDGSDPWGQKPNLLSPGEMDTESRRKG